MNRRGFLKVLGLGGAVAATAAVPMLNWIPANIGGLANPFQLGPFSETVTRRIDLMGEPWMLHHQLKIKNTFYEFFSLVYDYPDEQALTVVRQHAAAAFEQALRKI